MAQHHFKTRSPSLSSADSSSSFPTLTRYHSTRPLSTPHLPEAPLPPLPPAYFHTGIGGAGNYYKVKRNTGLTLPNSCTCEKQHPAVPQLLPSRVRSCSHDTRDMATTRAVPDNRGYHKKEMRHDEREMEMTRGGFGGGFIGGMTRSRGEGEKGMGLAEILGRKLKRAFGCSSRGKGAGGG